MKPIFLLILLLGSSAYAQKKTASAEKAPTQKEMQQMLKDAQRMMDEATQDLGPEEKKMMNDAMKQATQMAKEGKVPQMTASAEIPSKQTAILSGIPKLSGAQQYAGYLESLRSKAAKKVDAALISKVEAAVQRAKAQPVALNNLAPTFFLQKSPESAVYAAIRTAQLQEEPLAQNNLGVILHLTGYPQYALPVLEYLNKQSSTPNLLNNIGQCYLFWEIRSPPCAISWVASSPRPPTPKPTAVRH